jgi:hypothetical protein
VGTATNDDLTIIENKIHDTNVRIIRANHKLEIKAEKLSNLLEVSFTHIAKIYNSLESTNNRITELDLFIKASNVLTELTNAIRHLSALAADFETRVTLLNKGILPPIVGFQHLSELIQHGEERFTLLVFPMPYLNISNYHSVLSIISVQSTHIPEAFMMLIPFIDKNKNGLLYSAIEFPFRNSENVLLLPKVEPFLWATETEYCTIASMKECSRIETNQYICHANSTKLSNTVPSCLLAIRNKDPSTAEDVCNYYEIPAETEYYAKRIKNLWFVYLFKPTMATITCPVSRNNRVQSYEGLVVIHPPCSFNSKHVTLSTTQTFHTNFSTHYKILPLPTLNADINPKTHSHDVITEIQQHIATLQNLTFGDSMIDSTWTRKLHYGISGLTVILTIGSLIIVTIATLVYRQRMNRSSTIQPGDDEALPHCRDLPSDDLRSRPVFTSNQPSRTNSENKEIHFAPKHMNSWTTI